MHGRLVWAGMSESNATLTMRELSKVAERTMKEVWKTRCEWMNSIVVSAVAIAHPTGSVAFPRTEVFRGLTYGIGAPTRDFREKAVLQPSRDAGRHEGGPTHSRGAGLAGL